jgi:CubicO group peptidase (beta-lactamase class C family)/D-alanyl-D-alanine dipeptidase
MRFASLAVTVAVLILSAGLRGSPPTTRAASLTAAELGRYASVIERLEQVIPQQMQDKALPAVSIALVDGPDIVWARGFGWADTKAHTPATGDTVYRVGSVSKLFTDLAVMRLVERGALDLDAPLARYLPDFKPANPFGKPITLRQLMAHRSGLVREPPVGHYFDPTNPGLDRTIASLTGTELVYAPESHEKYSNAGITVVGAVLERTQHEPFARHVQQVVLQPFGLQHSSFELTPALDKDLAHGTMWTVHGRTFDAPTFPLGIGPAGNLYSTVNDLGRFLSAVFAGGRGPGGVVVKPETLERMWTPQFVPAGTKHGFGLGFRVDTFHGRRSVGHNGAVYGFATEVLALPDERLGVAVVTALDCANAVSARVAEIALDGMLAVREGKDLPKLEETQPVSAEMARGIVGRYEKGERGVELEERGGKLFAKPLRGGPVCLELRRLGDELMADDRIDRGLRMRAHDNQLTLNGESFVRVPQRKPAPSPARWAGLIGEYGWDYDTLYILEKDGKLQALIEWFFLYPLEEVTADVYKFPERGLYDGERLLFRRDAQGRATEVVAAGVDFKRQAIPGEDGSTFRIPPLRPVDELRREALAAQPPRESGYLRRPDLVDITSVVPTIKLDIRYATTNNFLGTKFYRSAKAYLQRPAAEALARAARRLADAGYGLLVHDAYRPWYVTKMFWEATPEASRVFVADPAKGSRHNRGCAVDLTLYDLRNGDVVPMVGGYDEFSDRSYPHYPGGTSLQRWHRELLRHAMEAEGFSVYEAEWWHFDYREWKHYPILNQTFEELAGH